ncbi:P-loop containing nucleoside triphosphate hydrolase protein [Wallemia mellicola]|uniref:ATP-dependent RNA helicase n=1 Tax=Wallemia mellicola TaxID=1708541 RepID=A0A4T0SAX5_9BASI|nr:P-loop containing nucleoside triphosphate hydrolase protein [Wallemia mellicola]TIB87326.1 P-loop containing nucleoside triphosphate hydrolase protein [Wallemia mellicola]TIC05112.1 P-loop containing nucleoside triphosphate hydrolase protein [Wallemia mellicola]TIC27298.1 P-loop containing nucleoside triphosphate hydrolase protein [Wallemia mellicola]TIC34991.1 P-loop containing nucleoside triphosphate hydrolase protein [Wallemia mellicola]
MPPYALNKRKRGQDLSWKKVDHKFADAEGDGWMGLEEIDGVDVDFEEGHSGERIVKLRSVQNVVDVPFEEDEEPDDAQDTQPEKKKSRKELKKAEKRDAAKKKRASAKQAKREVDEAKKPKEPAPEPEFDVTKLPEWSADNLSIAKDLPSALLRSLHENSIVTPTPIQKESLKASMIRKDVIVEGEIPEESLAALVLCPTRELALQVAGELKKFAPRVQDISRRVNVATVVGGMSIQKQKRQLQYANIVVATPGRLWEVLLDDGTLAKRAIRSQFLVIDEADRMIEAGHFEEMDKILRMTQRTSKSSTAAFQDEFESTEIGLPEEVPATDDMQTMVFSATLSKDLQQNLKRKRKAGSGKKKQEVKSSLDDLLMRLDFRDLEPSIIDLSPVNKVVSTLEEARVDCLSTDKDLYLYYFLLRYPGKTLVFVSSIDAIRRMIPLLETLKQHVFPLHSGLQQRQRLRNFDRFKSLPNAVMIATDVAARGLDVPSVDHVIHYQVPRTADAYIHRSGRTARAQRSGLAVIINIDSFSYTTDNGLSHLQIQFNILDQLKARINLATKIEATRHKTTKAKFDSNWEKEAADALGVDLDSDHEETQYNSRGQKKKRVGVANLTDKEENALEKQKAELKKLLSQPLMIRGVSSKYLTTNQSTLANEMVNNDSNEETIEIKREPLSNSNLNAPIESTHFEKEKERLVKEIGHEFEQALNNSNMLGRRLEEVLGVGKEFNTIAALWGVFGNIVGKDTKEDDNDSSSSIIHQQGIPGTGSIDELIYWPIPGRGEFIRLCFEHAGVSYVDTPGGIDQVMEYVSGDVDIGNNNIAFATPILKDNTNGVAIAQTPAILLYLSTRLGLSSDDEIQKIQIHQHALTALDLCSEAHNTHHPISANLYYEDQKVESERFSESFRNERIPKFLTHFETILSKNLKAQKKYLVGDHITYADYALWQVIDVILSYSFPKRMQTLLPDYKNINAFYDNIKSQDHMLSYLKSDRRLPYTDGIFRHYPELDAE